MKKGPLETNVSGGPLRQKKNELTSQLIIAR